MAYNAVSVAKTDRRTPKLEPILVKLTNFVASENIAEQLTDEQLQTIGYDVEREYKIDKQSREDWEKSAIKAMDVALQVRQAKNYPFEGASNIKYPLVTVAALQFGARAYPAIIDGNRVVKCQVIGSDEGQPAIDPQTGQPAMQMGPDGQPVMGPNGQPQIQWQVPPGAKRERADRISEHMSYQLLTEMEEWEEDTDVLLHHIPIIGCAFRKVWRSEELKRNKAEMIPAVDLVVNQKTKALATSPRVTHALTFYEQEIEEKKRAGIWLDIDLPSPNEAGDDNDAPHKFLEQHRYLDLDEDGYREPYIVTVHEESCQVVRIVANFRMEDIQFDQKRITRIPKAQYFVKYSFIPDPRGGFYDIGFGRLLESLSETIDTTLNQMLDAGHLSVAGGGFIGSGIRFKKNKVQVSPGKYEVVSFAGNSLKDQIHAHQFPEPSPVLFNLLGMMIEAAKDITAVKDILTGDSGTKGVQTATTTLALIEQGLKVFTAIYKRIYRALKQEFKLLFLLNAQFLDEKAYYTVMDTQKAVAKSDYDPKNFDVQPVSDPKMVTDMQRGAKAQVLMSLSEHPAIGPVFNPREVAKSVCAATGIEDVERLMKPEGGPNPMEQLAIEKAQADVKLVNSQATKTDADAALTITNVRLAPIKQAHDMESGNAKLVHDARRDHHGMLMGENAAHVAAGKHELDTARHEHEKKNAAATNEREDFKTTTDHEHRKADREQVDRHQTADRQQADKHHTTDREQTDRHHGDKIKQANDRGKKLKSDPAGGDIDDTADAVDSMAESVTTLAVAVKDAVKEVTTDVKGLHADMSAPVAIQRGADGKPVAVTKGDRTMKVVTGPDGKPTGLK